MGDHCHRTTVASIGEKLPGRPSTPEELLCSPYGDMDEVLGIAVFDARNDAYLVGARLGARDPIPLPAHRIERAIVLGRQHCLVLTVGECVGQLPARSSCRRRTSPNERVPRSEPRSTITLSLPGREQCLRRVVDEDRGIVGDQLYHRSPRRIRATVRSVSQRDGQSDRAADLGPRITAATCRISRPRCRQTTGETASISGSR